MRLVAPSKLGTRDALFSFAVTANLERQREAARLMTRFAEHTGLTPAGDEVRYLWTDAFAVCNFLGLARATGDRSFTDLALRLIDRVHRVLGRHRPDDVRSGWLSGLDDAEAELHPTRGGLRIGKPLPERRPEDPIDERLEWERDGQYFHYLSKWMHALDQAARATGQARYSRWSRELAQAAYATFARTSAAAGRPRMAWKMSIDLSRPLVASMGQHDPLDGFITCAQLQSTASQLADPSSAEPSLREATRGFAAMAESGSWVTADPLGLGGLLSDACRVAQLMPQHAFGGDGLLRALLGAALRGLSEYDGRTELRQPASHRLAFRELGLSIGLQATRVIAARVSSRPGAFVAAASISALLEQLRAYVALGSSIESFWMQPSRQRADSWVSHQDINDVMLATSLVPEGFLCL